MNVLVVCGALLVAVGAVGGCSDTTKRPEIDRCDKIWNELAKQNPDGARAADKDSFVAQCRKKMPGNEIKGFSQQNPAAEAEQQLRRLGTRAKIAYERKAAFPAFTAPLTPSEPCCKNGDEHGRCKYDAKRWEAFQGVAFDPRGPHFFQYSYESTEPNSYVAKAVGDIDCDGTMITYALEVRVVDNKISERLVTPTNPD